MMRITRGLLWGVADAGTEPVWALLIAMGFSVKQVGANGLVRQCAIFRCDSAIPLAS
jgi:hypothetical protein